MDSHNKNPDCAKCGNPGEYLWAMGGDPYWFCRGCHIVLKFYDSSVLIQRFLNDKLPLKTIQKEMIEARKARNTGESPWKEEKQ
jgi:hypothetical protein